MTNHSYGVFDADNHLYESPDVITTYLPREHSREIQFVEVRGRTRISVKGRIMEYIPNPTFERVAAPGAHVAFYSANNPEGLTMREMSGEPIDCLPGFREPAPRLELMDDFGVHRTLMFPTLANLLEHALEGDPDLTHVAVHAVNQWMHDVWSFNYRDRIYAVPVITLCLLDEAIKELEWVLAEGAKVILVKPAPAVGYKGSRSIALPEFDPFWARVQEAGVPVCFHASFPPLTAYYDTWEPGRTENAFKSTPLRSMLVRHRDIEDTLAAMLCEGALSRFPELKVWSVENGAIWLPSLFRELEHLYRKMPQEFAEHPLDVFRRNVYISPFWEDDVREVIDHVGVGHVAFGSDYPHPEGLAEPLEYLAYLDKAEVGDADQQAIMSDNANRLLGLAS